MHTDNTCTPTSQCQGWDLSSLLDLLAGGVLLLHRHGHLFVGSGHQDGVEGVQADHVEVVHSPCQDTARL